MSTTNNQDRDRKGDTSRTSDQGRKLASGGDTDKRRGNPEIDEDTKNVKQLLEDIKWLSANEK